MLEYCDSDLLQKCNQAQGLHSDNDLRTVASQLFGAMDLLHSNHVIHRDLKLENVLLQNGQVKLADFGLAQYPSFPLFLLRYVPQFAHPNGHALTEACGTKGYMAPEVLRGTGYNQKADVFSLGVILYELKTGNLPRFEKDQIVLGKEVPAKLRDLITKMTKPKPMLRLTIKEVLRHDWMIG